MSSSRLATVSVEILDVKPRSRVTSTSVEVLGIFDSNSRAAALSVELLEVLGQRKTYQTFVRKGSEWVEAEAVQTHVADAWDDAEVRCYVDGEWQLLFR